MEKEAVAELARGEMDRAVVGAQIDLTCARVDGHIVIDPLAFWYFSFYDDLHPSPIKRKAENGQPLKAGQLFLSF